MHRGRSDLPLRPWLHELAWRGGGRGLVYSGGVSAERRVGDMMADVGGCLVAFPERR